MRSTLETVRWWLLIVLLIGVVGTIVELLLLKHVDGVWQLAPVVLLGLSIVMLSWYGIAKSPASVRAIRMVMVLFVASGGVGAIQHFRGNVEYERESNPSLSGMELYTGAMMGSTPALAPGAMIQLGLIGLLFTYRHPKLARESDNEKQP
jgi:hypothetical protein